jgi:hypothetical protein
MSTYGPVELATAETSADELGPPGALHIGILADCCIDPSIAEFLRRMLGIDHSTRLIILCDPALGPNAGFPKRHRPVWVEATDNARIQLCERYLSARGTWRNVVISIALRLFPMQ